LARDLPPGRRRLVLIAAWRFATDPGRRLGQKAFGGGGGLVEPCLEPAQGVLSRRRFAVSLGGFLLIH
jgi:hypothetical protein